MRYLVDTNVLLRYARQTDAQHAIAFRSIDTLHARRYDLYVATQNLTEFWNVATRPAVRNGLGQSVSDADITLHTLERLFPRLTETASTYDEWRRLVVQFGVSGVQVHDAHLVAIMLSYGVTHILTFNTTDFARYAPVGVVAIDPTHV